MPADEHSRSTAAFPGGEGQPGMDPGEEQVETEPLDLGEGPDKVIRQQNVGLGEEFGSGEFPDRAAAPEEPAPGAVGYDPRA